MECIYFIRNTVTNSIKVGRASNAQKRLRDLQTGNEFQLVIYKTIESKSHKRIVKLEKQLHDYFKANIIKRFDFTQGRYVETEWFTITLEQVDYIIDNLKILA